MREKTTTLVPGKKNMGHQMAGVLHLRLSIERQGESLSKSIRNWPCLIVFANAPLT